ncbi:DgyrCDS4977 [Dimorphilus gyrociliatus]|uniref:DgyrCDS4977 n=1 Tax=Dimorphilus gyrociliatus TaxID=2664684 RepID=A0A7I8VJ31_9ANNE|nr:DgyrCDS4977 [Dimorphilus gyrociliatus]
MHSNVTVVTTQPTAVLVHQFREFPVQMNCTRCNAQILTATDYEVGALTWVLAADYIKASQAIDCENLPHSFTIDEVFHFSLPRIISKNISSPNNVRIEFIIIPEPDNIDKDHFVFASRDLDMFEIIQNPYRIDILELKEHDAVTASVELEYCFSYGIFGYGYSTIFALSCLNKPFKDILSHCLFFRPEVISKRLDSGRQYKN